MLVATIDRWKLDAGRRVLLREPADTEPAHRPAGGQHVERGDLLGKHRRMMAKCRRHEHAETDALGDRGKPGQRGVRLGQVGPRRADLRDLAEVIHHPDVIDSGGLGVRGDRAQM